MVWPVAVPCPVKLTARGISPLAGLPVRLRQVTVGLAGGLGVGVGIGVGVGLGVGLGVGVG